MKNYKSTINNYPLRSLLAAVCAWAILVSLVPPVMATEVPETATATTVGATEEATEELVPPTTTATVPETTAETEGENSLEETLRAEIAAYNERNGISPEMPDSALANAYFALDSNGAMAAWEDAHAIIDQGANLTTEEAETLQSEKNTKLFLRFYDIMVQINTPMTLDVYTHNPSSAPEITVTVDSDDTSTDDNGTITATATGKAASGCGSSASAGTTTITITASGRGTISFAWAVTWANQGKGSITFNGTGNNDSNGSIETSLDSGKSYVIIATSDANKDSKATVTLSNFKYTPPPETAVFTFEYDESLGSITVAGSPVDSGYVKDDVPNTGVAVTATPASTNVSFLGWIDEKGKLFSQEASTTLVPAGDTTVHAVFIDSTASGWYLVSKTHLYNDLNAASDFALTQSDKSIVLLNDATLPAGDYTIDAGVTFLVPFDAAGTCYVEKPVAEFTSGTPAPSGPYRTLTMAKDAKLIVNGTMSVSSKVMAGNAGGAATMPRDKFGHVLMQEGSSITVNGKLSVYGYITGSGSVVANSGASLYEGFQVRDFRGGSATSGMNNNSKDVFPLSQYYVQNIEVPLTIHSGATETAYVSLHMSDTVIESTVSYIGSSGCLFNLTSGYLVKQYDKTNDRLQIDIHGDLSIASFSLDIKYLMQVTVNSANYVLPITNNMTVNLNSGKVTIGADMAMLPGSQINIGAGTTVTLSSGKRLYLYDLSEWSGKGFVFSNSDMMALKYVYNRTKTRTASDLSDALITVAGTLDTSSGSLYTTASGAAITGVDGGSVKLSNGTETVTYQATQSGTNITYAEIAITSAQLQNADTSYVATAGAPGTYKYAHGKWLLGEHTITSVDTAPTCTEPGYTTHTCACGYSYTDSEAAATGHSYTTTTELPTYTTAGSTTSTCSECGDKTITQIIAAKIDDKEYTILSEAITAAAGTDTVVLQTTFDETDALVVSKALTIDKYGYAVEIEAGTGYGKTETGNTVNIWKRIIAGTSVRAGDCLDIYFYVTGLEGNGYEARITREKDGVTETLESIPASKWQASGSYRRFACTDIAAKEMTDVVTVTIYDTAGNKVSETVTESIEAYALRTLEKRSGAELQTALVDMLNYGADAQKHFNYSPNKLANANLSDEEKALATPEDAELEKGMTGTTTGDITFAGASVSAGSTLYLNFYFKGITESNKGDYRAVLTYEDHYGTNKEREISGSTFVNTATSDGTVVFGPQLTGLAAADGRQDVSCTIYKGNEKIAEATASVEGYVNTTLKSTTSETLTNVCKSLMKFVDSAHAYFRSLES